MGDLVTFVQQWWLGILAGLPVVAILAGWGAWWWKRIEEGAKTEPGISPPHIEEG